MATPPIELHSPTKRQRRRKTVLVVSAGVALLICLIGAYIIGFVPSFARFPVDLPEDEIGPGHWTSDSYSLAELKGGRVFTARLDGVVGYASGASHNQLDRLREYFEAAGADLGWELGKTTETCESYLPEASLFVETHPGNVLQFQEKNKPVYSGGTYLGDLACVSILPTNLDPQSGYEVFHITVLTVRQSPLMALAEYLGGL